MKDTGWKSHVEMGLLSCHLISSVLTRIILLSQREETTICAVIITRRKEVGSPKDGEEVGGGLSVRVNALLILNETKHL